MERAVEIRLDLLESGLLTLTRAVQSLTETIGVQAQAIDALAAAIEQLHAQEEEEPRHQFLSDR